MQPKELIGLWDSAPLDFGATESTRLALAPDGTGWTAVTSPTGPPRVRELAAWDCPKPDVLELRYADYEFVRTQFTVRTEVLQVTQLVESARQFALARRDVPQDEASRAGAPEEAANGRR